MTHEILGQRVAYATDNGATPWWALNGAIKLSPTFVGTIPFYECAQLAGWFYPTEKADVFALVDGQYLPISDKAIMRRPLPDDDEWRYFGMASDGYELINNENLARLLEPIAEYCPPDVAGVLKKGQCIFATFRANELNIYCNGKRDHLQNYLLVYEDKSAGNAIQIIHSPVRTVCMNTVRAAMSAGTYNLSIAHTTGVNDMVGWAANTLASIAGGEKGLQSAMQMMASKVIQANAEREMFEAVWPEPAMPEVLRLSTSERAGQFPKALIEKMESDWQYNIKRMVGFRDAAAEVYEGGVQGAAGTVWGAYNAVTDVCDHRSIGKNHMSGHTLASSAQFGERATMKGRAWATGMAMAK